MILLPWFLKAVDLTFLALRDLSDALCAPVLYIRLNAVNQTYIMSFLLRTSKRESHTAASFTESEFINHESKRQKCKAAWTQNDLLPVKSSTADSLSVI